MWCSRAISANDLSPKHRLKLLQTIGSSNIQPTSRDLRFYLLASLFAALTAVGAFLKIPIPYVPITLQTFFVILSGMLLGRKFGALSQLIYLMAGLAGAPIFSYGGGPGYVFQPTFGYLLGFPIAAYVTGALAHRRSNDADPAIWQLVLASAAGILIILSLGASVLYLNLNFVVGESISLSRVLVGYFLVFIPGDIVKIALAVLLSKSTLKIISIH